MHTAPVTHTPPHWPPSHVPAASLPARFLLLFQAQQRGGAACSRVSAPAGRLSSDGDTKNYWGKWWGKRQKGVTGVIEEKVRGYWWERKWTGAKGGEGVNMEEMWVTG